jgi:hypothetical protein
MQDVLYHEVTPRTDRSAGLHNLNPRHLTQYELDHYSTLVDPVDLPEDWKLEIIARRNKKSTSVHV